MKWLIFQQLYGSVGNDINHILALKGIAAVRLKDIIRYPNKWNLIKNEQMHQDFVARAESCFKEGKLDLAADWVALCLYWEQVQEDPFENM